MAVCIAQMQRPGVILLFKKKPKKHVLFFLEKKKRRMTPDLFIWKMYAAKTCLISSDPFAQQSSYVRTWRRQDKCGDVTLLYRIGWLVDGDQKYAKCIHLCGFKMQRNDCCRGSMLFPGKLVSVQSSSRSCTRDIWNPTTDRHDLTLRIHRIDATLKNM